MYTGSQFSLGYILAISQLIPALTLLDNHRHRHIISLHALMWRHATRDTPCNQYCWFVRLCILQIITRSRIGERSITNHTYVCQSASISQKRDVQLSPMCILPVAMAWSRGNTLCTSGFGWRHICSSVARRKVTQAVHLLKITRQGAAPERERNLMSTISLFAPLRLCPPSLAVYFIPYAVVECSVFLLTDTLVVHSLSMVDWSHIVAYFATSGLSVGCMVTKLARMDARRSLLIFYRAALAGLLCIQSLSWTRTGCSASCRNAVTASALL